MTEENNTGNFKKDNLFYKFKAVSSKKKILIISGIILIICIVGIFAYRTNEKNKYNQYNKYINLASTALKRDNFDEAINNYKLAGNYNLKYESITDVNNINDIRDSKANYEKGIENFNRQDYFKAFDKFKLVIPIDQKRYSDANEKIQVCVDKTFTNYLDLAKKSMKGNKYEEAMKYLDMVIKMQPDNEELNKLYSQCKLGADKIKAEAEAKAQAEQAAKDAKEAEAQAKQEAKALAEAKAKAKTEGVTIGMTEQQVLDSMWGKPDQINKTVTAYSTSEQWVYGMNSSKMNFLYFDNGILTSIQN